MKRWWVVLGLAAVLNAALVGSGSAAIPPKATAGAAMGQDLLDAQAVLSKAFHDAHCPKAPCPPNPMTTPADAELRTFAIEMAKAQGYATVAHAPGYLGTTTNEPNLDPGVNEPVPSLIMQIDGQGAMTGLWWKTGPAPIDWVLLGGGAAGSVDSRRLYFWDSVAGGGGAELYPRIKTNLGNGQYSATVSSGSGITGIASLVTPVGSPGIARFSAGDYKARFWAKVDNANGVTKFGLGVWMQTGAQRFQLGSTAWTDDVDSLAASARALRVSVTADALHHSSGGDTDRLYVMLSAQSTSTVPVTVTVNFDDSSHVSYLDVPFGVRDSASTTPTDPARFTALLATSDVNLDVQAALEKLDRHTHTGMVTDTDLVHSSAPVAVEGGGLSIRPATATGTSTGTLTAVGVGNAPVLSLSAKLKAGPGVALQGTGTATATEAYLREDPTVQVVLGSNVQPLGSATASGTSTTLSPSDHRHSHGDQAGGTLHAIVTTLVNGFMAAADKIKLDAIPSPTSIVTSTNTNTNLSGSGTAGYGAKWSGTYSLVPSLYYDDGANAGIGVGTNVSASYKLTVGGSAWIAGDVNISGGIIGGGVAVACSSGSIPRANSSGKIDTSCMPTNVLYGSLIVGKIPVATGAQSLGDSLISQNTTNTSISVAGDLGVGAASTSDGWNRTLRLNGSSTARLILTTDDASAVGGLFQHQGWMGAPGLLVGTTSNHKFGIVVNNALQGTWSTSGLGIGIAGPENAEGWQHAFEVHGTDNAKLQLTTTSGSMIGGIWAASLPFISNAGIYYGTRSNHAVYLITNGTLRLTLGTDGTATLPGKLSVGGGVELTGDTALGSNSISKSADGVLIVAGQTNGFRVNNYNNSVELMKVTASGLTAVNITSTPGTYKIPNTGAGTNLDSWVSFTPYVLQSSGGLTPTYLPIASGGRALSDGPFRLYSGIVYGDSVGLSLGGPVYATNISDGAGAAIIVKTDSGGHLNGGIIPYGGATPPPAYWGATPGPGTSYYTARENHAHPPVVQVSWAGGPGYTQWYLVQPSTTTVGRLIEWPASLDNIGSSSQADISFEYYCDSLSTCGLYYIVYIGGTPGSCDGSVVTNGTTTVSSYQFVRRNYRVGFTYSGESGIKVCARSTFDEGVGGYLYLKGAHIQMTKNG